MHNLSITSGRDTSLIGAQAKGDSVTMDVGRDLTLKSLQDTDDDRYQKTKKPEPKFELSLKIWR
ncbi:hemagglutinin repeat-containing protein [Pragia fontium]|uniref:hemagglutinin repeat-containing protein n=1 Tax=Pragia fontium TaxID=82985 RepID=UPI0008FFCC62|nr:hemagglutinin repeat-containing protein [Pragia fontium]